jgi:hypothetical protein
MEHLMRSIVRLCLAGVLVAAPIAGAQAHGTEDHSAAARRAPLPAKAVQTRAALRDLWVGHVFWVRNVAVATLAKNDAAAKAAEEAAVANAKAIAAAFEPYYGAPAKDALFKLLAGHYGAIKAYLLATAAGDAPAQSKATTALTKNADEIAVFLSKANPNLPKDAVNGLLLAHGGHHIQQILELKDGKYEAEAKTWEEMKGHMYVIADALTQALAKQFAKRF